MFQPSRRCVLGAALAAIGLPAASSAMDGTADDTAPSPALADLIRHPLLVASLYRLPVGTAERVLERRFRGRGKGWFEGGVEAGT